jgi:two-component system, chemotaxis family, sensor kinase Cph1
MSQNLTETEQKVDLTTCDREPINLPGSIQPHGILLALEETSFKILQVSSNTFEYIGLQPQELLEQKLNKILCTEQIEAIAHCLSEDFDSVNPLHISIDKQGEKLNFNGIVHRSNEVIILELEPIERDEEINFFNFHYLVKKPIAKIQNASNLAELSEVIVNEIRRISGFDRVMVYQFDEEGIGEVIAEATNEDLTPFLGLRYPPSDIPKQARQLYTLNLLRIIPDVNYTPVKIVPDRALDLSLSALRSVSPIHIEYLNNMGVTASMSISLLKNKQLWGLIACHHQTPKHINYQTRTICEFFGQVMSLELATKEDNQDLDYKIKLKSIQSQFVESISQAEDLVSGLVEDGNNLLELVGARGAAICFDGQINLIGKTPDREDVKTLLDWLAPRMEDVLIWQSNCLPKDYLTAEKYKAVGSGLLALTISKSPKNCLLWFRPEVIQTVNWGGDPNKPVEIEENGIRLSPRKSFAKWQENVKFKSLAWKKCEIEAALELRSNIVGIVFRKAEELAKINIELERSNDELDAFAYIASHDLKEPLRGIHNYSSFLIEDYGNILTEDGVTKLQTLMSLTQRMENLINSLLHFSRLGRTELSMQKTDLNESIEHVIDTLNISFKEEPLEIRIPRPLPIVNCDRVLISEVFSNLISNAIKYNNNARKWVEIGWYDEDRSKAIPCFYEGQNRNHQIVFYIKDNGIGIREKHQETIFRIFKRLHAAQKYGGGTGAGLTIVKKIIERHGGRIWVESVYGQGSTFFFTLQKPIG